MDDYETPRKGLILASDDLIVGNHYAVLGCKLHSSPVPVGGMAFQVKAINLPYVVGSLVCNGEAITLDTRFLNLMRVDDAYVAAQSPAIPGNMVMMPAHLLAMLKGIKP